MSATKRSPGLLAGAIVGALLTAPLIALLYLADRALGLPFAPFDLFDWFGRLVPGDLITAVIDVMVDAIIALNLGAVDSTAKTIEQLMGLGMMIGVGLVAGALVYSFLNRSQSTNPYLAGGGVGLLIGVFFVLIFNEVNLTATADPNLSRVWLVAVFTVWGLTLGWIYARLVAIADGVEATQQARSVISGGEPQPEAVATATQNRAVQIDRRNFLVGVGGATATLTVVGAGLSLLVEPRDEVAGPDDVTTLPQTGDQAAVPEGVPTTGDGQPLPNADATLEPAPGTRPEYTPLDDHYRIDISARPPVIDGATWSVVVDGLVDEPFSMTLEDIQSYPTVDQFVTLSCISNRIAGDLISTTRWTGAPLKNIIDDWVLMPGATHLRIVSADGFDEYVPLVDIRMDERIMLCWAWDGQPLKRQHGFPLRIYIPDLYGMKQPKWITEIEVVDSWGEGYWVRRGWSATARVNATSVIDTVAAEAAYERDGQVYVPIGGIAYAGDRGISRVEVAVGQNDWVDAEVREPMSETTWVIWRYDWPFEEGRFPFRVRCYEGNGRIQVEEVQGVRPDGATGIHTVREDVQLPEEIAQA